MIEDGFSTPKFDGTDILVGPVPNSISCSDSGDLIWYCATNESGLSDSEVGLGTIAFVDLNVSSSEAKCSCFSLGGTAGMVFSLGSR